MFTTWGRSPLSDMTLAAVIKRMNERAAPGAQYLDADGRAIKPHGFRSSFRVWAAEEPNRPKDVAEFALAHKLPDPVEAAYQRSTLFEARKSLMQSWDDWVTKGK